MANEIFIVYVNDDKTLDPVRISASNCAILQDTRPIIMGKFRRPNPSGPGWFQDEFSGWPVFAVKRYLPKGQLPGGHTITRARERDGAQPPEAREIHFDDNGANGRHVIWPETIPQAAVGGAIAVLRGYDFNEPDWQSLLDQARAMDPDDTPLTE